MINRKMNIKNYPGAKRNSGFQQLLLNNTPNFDIFADVFAGSGSIADFFYEISPEKQYYVTEAFDLVAQQLSSMFTGKANVNVLHTDGLDNLRKLVANIEGKKLLAYFDPPYLMETRRSKRKLYGVEWSFPDHIEFLNYVRSSIDNVYYVISHYPCSLYDEKLRDWHTVDLRTRTRASTVIERLYMNYDPATVTPVSNHLAGVDFTDRQRIKRKVENMIRKIETLPAREKAAMLEAIQKRLL